MKTIKNSKDITTLEVDDKIIFGNSEYKVKLRDSGIGYYLYHHICSNNTIFLDLHLDIESFCNHLGISILNKHHLHNGSFPETKSLEALTAIVSALFKEYEKQNELPETWEEFCKNTPIQKGECLINAFSEIKKTISAGDDRDADEDRTYFTSVQEAKAFLAFMQLRQLRKAYVKDWEPDWKNYDMRKYMITFNCNNVGITAKTTGSHPMSFPTYELAEQFLNNFKDLLEIAKPLL